MVFSSIIAIIGVSAALVSALAAFLAYKFSRKAHEDTLALVLPKERPLIVLVDEYAHKIYENVNTHIEEFEFKFKLKNIGTRPADDLIIKLGLAELNKPKTFHEIHKPITVCNTFYQETDIPFDDYLSVAFLERKVKKQEDLLLLIYLRLEYKDKWNLDKLYCDDFYLVYSNWLGDLAHATKEIKERFKVNIERVFGVFKVM